MLAHYTREDRAGLCRVLKIFAPLPAYWGELLLLLPSCAHCATAQPCLSRHRCFAERQHSSISKTARYICVCVDNKLSNTRDSIVSSTSACCCFRHTITVDHPDINDEYFPHLAYIRYCNCRPSSCHVCVCVCASPLNKPFVAPPEQTFSPALRTCVSASLSHSSPWCVRHHHHVSHTVVSPCSPPHTALLLPTVSVPSVITRPVADTNAATKDGCRHDCNLCLLHLCWLCASRHLQGPCQLGT